jgi:aspartokinase/homoserine dehydrogenase 1
VAALGELSERAADLLVARGERVSSALLAAALPAAGVKARAGRRRRDRDGRPPEAPRPIWRRLAAAQARLRPRCARAWCPWRATGSAPDSSVTTLGRGGSDLTATVLRALGARQVVL